MGAETGSTQGSQQHPDGSGPSFFALVPCAGIGARSGIEGPKQYAVIAGQSLVAHTLAALAGVARLSQVIVVLSADDSAFVDAAPGFDGWVERVGGDTRAITVANGLAALKARGAHDDDWVLVHDAARCLVRAEWIDRLIDECQGDDVGGLLAWPAADTLKLAASGAEHGAERVARTVDRHGVWQAQTPQMFRIGLLQKALAEAGTGITDEASAIEALGHSAKLVRGAFENFKLTYPPDFDIAERLLATRDSRDHSARGPDK
ncbi:2-C-methyl-D-erythritol 4-phosphate cytidylyltransferase [soil metagenome]